MFGRSPTKTPAAIRADEFNKKFGQYLTAMGADGYLSDEFEIFTAAGKLKVSLHGNWVQCKFDDPGRAQKILNPNNERHHKLQASGHWPHYFYQGQSVDRDLSIFSGFMDTILIAAFVTRDGKPHCMPGVKLLSGLLNPKPQTLEEALVPNQPAEIKYDGGTRPGTWRIVTPLKFFTENGEKYLEAVDGETNRIKKYIASKITEARIVAG